MSIPAIQSASVAKRPLVRRRSIADLLAPLEKIAAHSVSLVANYGARFEVGSETYELPHYLFVGPKGGDLPNDLDKKGMFPVNPHPGYLGKG